MDRFHHLAVVISRCGALISGGLLLVSAFVVAIDVVLRGFFASSIGGSDELSGYALAIATAWGMSYALIDRAHVRVASLYEVVPMRIRALLDMVSLISFFVFMLLTTQYAWTSLAQSITSKARSISPLSIPIAIPQSIWFAGFVFLLVVLILLIVEATRALSGGDLRKVAALIGAKGVDEEVDDEWAARRAAADPKP